MCVYVRLKRDVSVNSVHLRLTDSVTYAFPVQLFTLRKPAFPVQCVTVFTVVQAVVKAIAEVMGNSKYRPPAAPKPLNGFWWNLEYITTSRVWTHMQIHVGGLGERVTCHLFRFESSQLISDPPKSLGPLLSAYNTTLSSLLDKHAPIVNKLTRRQSPSNPWFSATLRAFRSTLRYAENIWKRTHSAADWSSFKSLRNQYHKLILSSKQEAQLSPRDRAMRRVNWNLANCHATVQKLVKAYTTSPDQIDGMKLEI